MTTIRAKCPTCGDVDVAADSITLELHPTGDQGEYSFECSLCESVVTKPASRRTAALLIAAGIDPIETGTVDAPGSLLPYDDLSPDPLAPPLSLDDVITFHYLLEDDAAWAEAMAVHAYGV
jgi:hypothetical protein